MPIYWAYVPGPAYVRQWALLPNRDSALSPANVAAAKAHFQQEVWRLLADRKDTGAMVRICTRYRVNAGGTNPALEVIPGRFLPDETFDYITAESWDAGGFTLREYTASLHGEPTVDEEETSGDARGDWQYMLTADVLKQNDGGYIVLCIIQKDSDETDPTEGDPVGEPALWRYRAWTTSQDPDTDAPILDKLQFNGYALKLPEGDRYNIRVNDERYEVPEMYATVEIPARTEARACRVTKAKKAAGSWRREVVDVQIIGRDANNQDITKNVYGNKLYITGVHPMGGENIPELWDGDVVKEVRVHVVGTRDGQFVRENTVFWIPKNGPWSYGTDWYLGAVHEANQPFSGDPFVPCNGGSVTSVWIISEPTGGERSCIGDSYQINIDEPNNETQKPHLITSMAHQLQYRPGLGFVYAYVWANAGWQKYTNLPGGDDPSVVASDPPPEVTQVKLRLITKEFGIPIGYRTLSLPAAGGGSGGVPDGTPTIIAPVGSRVYVSATAYDASGNIIDDSPDELGAYIAYYGEPLRIEGKKVKFF